MAPAQWMTAFSFTLSKVKVILGVVLLHAPVGNWLALSLSLCPGSVVRTLEGVSWGGGMGKMVSKHDYFTGTLSLVYNYFNHEKFSREAGLPKQGPRW